MEQAYKLKFSGGQTGELYVNCCGCSKTLPLHSFGPAVRPYYLIHIVLGGKGIYRHGEQEYCLQRGSGFLISPGELAFYQADEKEPWTYAWVGFNGSLAEELLQQMGLSQLHPVFTSQKAEELYDTVKEMMKYTTYGMTNELRRNGLLRLFLATIAEDIKLQEQEGEDKANAYVKRAIGFVSNNYCNPIRITDIADFVCINRSYLYTLFQSELGISPQQFLTAFRIARAVQLLQSTDLPVESIAISCGYSDPLVFSKAFRLKKGKTPSVFRKEMQQNNQVKDTSDLEDIEQFIEQHRKK